jgi:hypothetical protein
MPATSQNLETKGLRGKIFHLKDLEGTDRRLDSIAISLRHFAIETGSCTAPVCAFCILSQGCSSQEAEILLWKAVEKAARLLARLGDMGSASV